MNRYLWLALAFILSMGVSVAAEDAPDAEEVLARSIDYHDPQGLWAGSRFRLEIRETRPEGPDRKTRLQFDNSQNAFEYLSHRDGVVIEGLMADGECVITLNGSLDFSDEEREKYRLTCERLKWIRNYHTYLWGLPMKLRDPGTLIEALARDDEYDGQSVWSIRVTYDEAVGSDIWYFYFDKETCALVGYRFYHNEADHDGEYILLEGEIESNGFRIPARRSWYTHGNERHLGDDILTDIEITRR